MSESNVDAQIRHNLLGREGPVGARDLLFGCVPFGAVAAHFMFPPKPKQNKTKKKKFSPISHAKFSTSLPPRLDGHERATLKTLSLKPIRNNFGPLENENMGLKKNPFLCLAVLFLVVAP